MGPSATSRRQCSPSLLLISLPLGLAFDDFDEQQSGATVWCQHGQSTAQGHSMIASSFTLEDPLSSQIPLWVPSLLTFAACRLALLRASTVSELRKAKNPPASRSARLIMAAALRTVVCVAHPQGQQAPQPRGVATRAVSFPAQPQHLTTFAAQSGQSQRLQEGPSCPWPSTSHNEGHAAAGSSTRGVWAHLTSSKVRRSSYKPCRRSQGGGGFCRSGMTRRCLAERPLVCSLQPGITIR